MQMYLRIELYYLRIVGCNYAFRMLNFMVPTQIIGVSGVPPLMIVCGCSDMNKHVVERMIILV